MTRKPAIAGGEPIREAPLGYGGQSIGETEKESVLDVLESDYITRGPTVEAFEADVAEYVGVEHAVAVTSGTAALHLTGQALFEPGEEVVTSPLTFAATAFAATYAGATPVFADVKSTTRNVDPNAIREQISEETTAIVPVHFAGQPCAVDEILEIADEHDLTVVWDACHAIGSSRRGRMIGAEADVAVFSFHPVKNITTGEGGMIVTDDEEIASTVRSLRSFGMNYDPEGHGDEPWYQVTERPGFNYNFTDVQAAIGRAQLDRIGQFKRRRDEIVARYRDAFAELTGVHLAFEKEDVDPMWHLFTVEISDGFGCTRKEFVEAMHRENIYVQVHYVPLHYHPFFQETYEYQKGDFPETERVYERIVSLPLFPRMEDSDIEDVVTAVLDIHDHYS